jgi:hypothetical protein
MRAVEGALRKLCAEVGFERLTQRQKAGGRLRYTPAAYSQWEKILDQLPSNVDHKLMRLRPGQTKQRRQEFYEQAVEDNRAFKDAWRNHVMHARTEYGDGEAEHIFRHVNALMIRLA